MSKISHEWFMITENPLLQNKSFVDSEIADEMLDCLIGLIKVSYDSYKVSLVSFMSDDDGTIEHFKKYYKGICYVDPDLITIIEKVTGKKIEEILK